MTAAFARRSPAAIALALGTVYLVWGSTYLAIRVTDRTLPPLLMSSVRFLIAGTALYVFASRGRARPTRREWLAAAIAGAALLLVGNGGVAWAETRLDSGFAALIVAIIPLYVALMDRVFFGRRLSPAAVTGLVVGFGGVALLVRPGGGGNVGVAVALGTVFVNEAIGWSTIVAGAAIVTAVVLIVTARTPADRRYPEPDEELQSATGQGPLGAGVPRRSRARAGAFRAWRRALLAGARQGPG